MCHQPSFHGALVGIVPQRQEIKEIRVFRDALAISVHVALPTDNAANLPSSAAVNAFIKSSRAG